MSQSMHLTFVPIHHTFCSRYKSDCVIYMYEFCSKASFFFNSYEHGIVVVKVQRSSAYMVSFVSTQTEKFHVTYQMNAQLIIYKMVFVSCSVSKSSQSYGCFFSTFIMRIF